MFDTFGLHNPVTVNPTLLTSDHRVISIDSDRLVLKLNTAEKARGVPVILVGSALIATAAAVLAWWLFKPSVPAWPLPVLALALTVSAVLSATREGTLVALRKENRIFVEWRNTVTRRKHRTLAAQLTELTGFDVRSLIDTESDMVPHPMYELRLDIGGKKVLWYCDARETAESIGQHLLRMRDAA